MSDLFLPENHENGRRIGGRLRKGARLACALVCGLAVRVGAAEPPRTEADAFADVRAQFAAPDARAGVNCWWWWLNGHTDTDAIDRELHAMKARHFQGAMIFDASGQNQRGNRDIPAGPTFGSPAWCDLFVHALDTAERLGLEMGVNIQSGWNLGGPSVTPEDAAKTLVCTERTFVGGDAVALPPQPRTRHGFYRDLAVLAFPVDDRHVADAPIHFLAEKLGARELGFSAADCRFLLTNDAADRSSAVRKRPFVVRRDAIVDLTGRLPWTAPDGTWVVMRIGYTCTDATISTASAGWTGRVLDYMSSAALDRYWQAVVEPILARAGHHVGTTLTHLETDSWECGGMNWTPGFEATFRALNGYDPIPYLAVLGGYVVDDIDATHAFLADFRKTIAETICQSHYGHFAALARARGLGIQPESAGPHTGPLDGLKNYAQSDIVMSEFWSPSPHRATPQSRYFVKQAASAAHLYGQRIVGAESFTTIGPHWNDCLWRDQKSAFDHEICSGLNRVYLHTFTSSPAGMGLPGQEYFAGTHINPRVTWWDESAGFFDYLRRVQSVVQNGRFVADAVYYYGDHVPNIYPLKEADLPGVLPGFDYDVADERALGALTVDAADGRLVGPHGTAYRLLVLPDHGVLSLAALRQVAHLLEDGATVAGAKPQRCVSLVGGAAAQAEFRALADRLWGDGADDVRRVGKGVLIAHGTARDGLLARTCPNFAARPADADAPTLDYIHYTIGARDVYFVCNLTDRAQTATCEFRVTGRQPELWEPLDGTQRDLTDFTVRDDRTAIPLRFDPCGACFVVFDAPLPAARADAGKGNFTSFTPVQELDGPWRVTFDPARGGPGEVTFPALADWTQATDDRIRYYSGAATYRRTFSFDKQPAARYALTLGAVRDAGFARVTLNGTDVGTVWTPPFRLDVTDALTTGENTLEITVVNGWHNRVMGDQLRRFARPLTQTNIVLGGRKGERLSPSGLLGPVRLLTATDAAEPPR